MSAYTTVYLTRRQAELIYIHANPDRIISNPARMTDKELGDALDRFGERSLNNFLITSGEEIPDEDLPWYMQKYLNMSFVS